MSLDTSRAQLDTMVADVLVRDAGTLEIFSERALACALVSVTQPLHASGTARQGADHVLSHGTNNNHVHACCRRCIWDVWLLLCLPLTALCRTASTAPVQI